MKIKISVIYMNGTCSEQTFDTTFTDFLDWFEEAIDTSTVRQINVVKLDA